VRRLSEYERRVAGAEAVGGAGAGAGVIASDAVGGAALQWEPSLEVSLQGGSGGATRAFGGAGNFRITAATSGRGRMPATSCSTSLLLLCRAAASSCSTFSGVSTGTSRRTAVSDTSPRARQVRTVGNVSAARATTVRLYAASSDKWSTCVQ
jgi:hypothetical protein